MEHPKRLKELQDNEEIMIPKSNTDISVKSDYVPKLEELLTTNPNLRSRKTRNINPFRKKN